jgi:two-component system LytT family response regulator
VKTLLGKNCRQVTVVGTAQSSEEALHVISEQNPDLIFLDIEMPYGTGFDLLNNFQKLDFEVIFVTAFEKHALKAFKFSVLDYILKPISEEYLVKAVNRAEERIKEKIINRNHDFFSGNVNNNHQSRNLALPTFTGLVFVKIDTISHCEANENYTWFYLTTKEKILVSHSISDYETLLEPYDFHRIHHSHIINLAHAKKYVRGRGGYVVMDDGTSINVSVRKKMDFLDKLLK